MLGNASVEHLKDCISTVFAALFDIWWENFLETILLWTYFAAAEILLSKHKLNSGQLLKNQKISFASQFMCNPTVLHKLPFNLFHLRWNNNFQDFLEINDQSVNWKPFCYLVKIRTHVPLVLNHQLFHFFLSSVVVKTLVKELHSSSNEI